MSQSPLIVDSRLPITWPVRIYMGATGVLLAALLLTARTLTPSETGAGTHQQLGLPPCTFIVKFGFRCPSCGMTTSWAHVTRGQFPSALASNVGGALMAASALAAAPWMLYMSAVGRTLAWHPSDVQCACFGAVVLAATLVDWFVRLSW